MEKDTKNTTIEECRKNMQMLRENSYFDRFREPDEDPRGGEGEPGAQYGNEPTQKPMETPTEPTGAEEPKGDVISNIRKAIISGLAEYADNIDDPNYQVLKKLFAIIDKRDEDNNAGDKMNNQYQQ